MMKRLQNIVAESKLTLPVSVVYALLVWLLSGLIDERLWAQLGCFAMTAWLMMVLNNSNALIRIYSRLVSASFLVLSCAACFLFPSLREAVAQLCITAATLIIFQAYQNQQAVGHAFYAFVAIGLSSMAYVHTLWLLPLLWLFMGSRLQMLSWRTFAASLFGLLLPYWFAACWLVYKADFTPLINHFAPLAAIETHIDYSQLTPGQLLTLALVVTAMLTGTIHHLRTSYLDKIRTRQLYAIFIGMNTVCLVLLCLQPQHFDFLLRLLLINTAPLIAHFLALTRTRATNIAFYLFAAAALALTVYNLWMSSSLF